MRNNHFDLLFQTHEDDYCVKRYENFQAFQKSSSQCYFNHNNKYL